MKNGKGSIIMKRAELFIIIILAALAPRCDDMGHDTLDSPGGFRYIIKNKASWSMRLGGINGDQINSITCDRSNNIIVAGSVYEQADLDGSRTFDDAYPESIGSYNFGGNDIFISKFDPSGAYQWAKRLGGMLTDEAYHVASDSENNIVVVGTVANDADLNGDGDQSDPWEIPTAGIHGENDIFISKFDSTGTHHWSYRLGGTAAGDNALGVTVDHDDCIVITGRIIDNADLNGDGDTDDLWEEPLGIHDMEDVFISKFDSSGTHRWAMRLGGAYHDRGCSIAHDAMNNVIVVGHVTDDADLNGDGDTSDPWEPGTLSTDADLFISKFDSSGAHLWARRLGGGGIDNAYQVAVDGKDGIVVAGRVSGNADLDGVGGIAVGEYPEDTAGLCYEGWDIFITKFSADGTNLWARRLGGVGEDAAFGLAVDRGGMVFVTGKITGNADLNGNGSSDDGGAEDEGIYGNTDAFIAAFNRNGEPIWSRRLGSTDTDSCQGIAINRSGDLIFGGYVNGESDLNGDGDFVDDYEAITSVVHGNNDAFLTVFPDNYFLFFP